MNNDKIFLTRAQTVSLIWHVPYMDRSVIDHKERELNRVCYRIINDDNEHSIKRSLIGDDNDGIVDFDLNSYLAQHIPNSNETHNGESSDIIDEMIEKMNETDRQILNLMDYYEKQ